jgi:hypothetical protein
VKGFKVEGVNALAMYDLPSATSYDVPTPGGAPMQAPSDVAVTRNTQYAYVIDRYARCAWKFKSTSVDVQDDPVHPSTFTLSQNYPNPFNPSTIISFSLPTAGYVRLFVTDLLGREIARIVDGHVAAGKHAEVFNAAHLTSGTYIYTLITPGATSSRTMLYLK